MYVAAASIECSRITSEPTLHDEFDRVFGFFVGYGRNMDAWIDCMTYLDEPDAGMTSIHVELGRVLSLELIDHAKLTRDNRDLYDAIVECSSFVNWRRIEQGNQPVIALSMEGRVYE